MKSFIVKLVLFFSPSKRRELEQAKLKVKESGVKTFRTAEMPKIKFENRGIEKGRLLMKLKGMSDMDHKHYEDKNRNTKLTGTLYINDDNFDDIVGECSSIYFF